MLMQTYEKEKMEAALNHLIFQFRHMDRKYDLMVNREINNHYEKGKQSFSAYEQKLAALRMEGLKKL